jgi:hypothetical protein
MVKFNSIPVVFGAVIKARNWKLTTIFSSSLHKFQDLIIFYSLNLIIEIANSYKTFLLEE